MNRNLEEIFEHSLTLNQLETGKMIFKTNNNRLKTRLKYRNSITKELRFLILLLLMLIMMILQTVEWEYYN